MQDALRAYLELALGLTEVSRKRATKVVRDLLGKGEAKASQAQAMAAELLETSRANRETLTRLVRYEVERALGAVGLATAEEVAELTARVQELERRLLSDADLTGTVVPGRAASGDQATAKEAGGARSASKQAPAKATGKKTAAKKTAAKKTTAKKTTAKQTTGKKTTAKKTASAPAESTEQSGGAA